MLMAIGGTRPGEVAGETLTRIVVTSRPYLVTQVYTIHKDTIYDDSAPNDGTLLGVHLFKKYLISGCFGHAARLSRSIVPSS